MFSLLLTSMMLMHLSVPVTLQSFIEQGSKVVSSIASVVTSTVVTSVVVVSVVVVVVSSIIPATVVMSVVVIVSTIEATLDFPEEKEFHFNLPNARVTPFSYSPLSSLLFS